MRMPLFQDSNPLVLFASLRLCARIALFLIASDCGREDVHIHVDNHEKPQGAVFSGTVSHQDFSSR
jgi:hypothetical protein